MGCGICVKTCPQQVISKDKDGINFKRDKCIACGKCVDACPQGAIELKGHYITVDELCKEVIKDRAYFGLKGGITFSGGEPMLQSEIILELAKKLKANKINSVAVDTAGLYDFTILEKILPYIDIVLFDLKIDDNEDMKK
jgi:pyruvate formate lyase activating enzyme